MTLPIVLYLLFTTGPLSRFRGWHHWAQIPFDVILLALWAAATALAVPDCNEYEKSFSICFEFLRR